MNPFNTPTTTVESFLKAEQERKQGELNSYERFLIRNRIFCEAQPFCFNKAVHVRKLDGHDYVLCDEHERLASQSTERQSQVTLDSWKGTIFSKEADAQFQHKAIIHDEEQP